MLQAQHPLPDRERAFREPLASLEVSRVKRDLSETLRAGRPVRSVA
jgi:hypothetical protein